MKKVCILLLCGFCVTSCSSSSSPTRKSLGAVPVIYVTTPSLYSFASTLAGKDAVVESLLPVGVSVHVWQAKPSDIAKLQQADLLIINGLDLEHFVEELGQTLPEKLIIVDTTRDIPREKLLAGDPDHGEAFDPHTWLDPDLALLQAKSVAQAIKTLLVEKQSVIDERYKAFESRITELKTFVANRLAESTVKKPFIVFHDAYQYYLRAFGLSQYYRGAFEEFPGKEPSASYLKTIIDQVQQKEVTLLFREPQFSPKIISTIAEEFPAVHVYELDPHGSIYAADGYERIVKMMTDTFITAFTSTAQEIE